MKTQKLFGAALLIATLLPLPVFAGSETGAYLEVTVAVADKNREAAAGVYKKYKQPFLTKIEGAESKTLLIRDEDVQVLHGFDNVEAAKAYLESDLFKNDVVVGLSPYLASEPDIRIYVAK